MTRVLVFVLVGVILPALLTGCGEVTKFRDGRGGAVYFVDCGSSLRQLQSCRALIESTCPDGFQRVPLVAARTQHEPPPRQRQWGYFRCADARN